MAIPTSGCIGIITCPNSVACTSIAQAVDGNVTPPKRLATLGSTAGFSSPYCMSDFYGYSSTPTYKCIYFCDISSTCPNYDSLTECTCSRLASNGAMSTGECYCPTFCWCLSRSGVGERTGTMIARICCNGSIKCTCCVVSANGTACSGSWSFLVDYNDTVCLLTCATRHVSDTTIKGVRASICLSSLISTSGSFCVGTPSYQLSQTSIPII